MIPNIDNMSYILYTGENRIFVPLNHPDDLWEHQEFDKKIPLVILVTGWTTNANSSNNAALNKIYAAYRCRGNTNFVVSSGVENLFNIKMYVIIFLIPFQYFS